MRDVGVGIQGNVGDGKVLTDQKRRTVELLFHDRQCAIAGFLHGAVLGHAFGRQAQIELDETGHRDRRLMAVLFEELPLQHLGAQPRFARQV